MRLIDADALKRRAQKVATESWKMRLTANVETVLNQFIDWIDQADTAKPEWILVSERLPESEEDVLVTRKFRGTSDGELPAKWYVEVANQCDRHWYAYSDEYKIGRHDDPIAWMPLPEPWKMEGEQNG